MEARSVREKTLREVEEHILDGVVIGLQFWFHAGSVLGTDHSTMGCIIGLVDEWTGGQSLVRMSDDGESLGKRLIICLFSRFV